MVAQYADACNLFASPDVGHKLDVLREHCDVIGRNYDDIEKTVMMSLDASDVDGLLSRLHDLSELGIQHVHGLVPVAETLEPLRILGEQVIPEAAKF